jgi:hypothetical protein
MMELEEREEGRWKEEGEVVEERQNEKGRRQGEEERDSKRKVIESSSVEE